MGEKKKSKISKGMMEDYTGPDIIKEDAPKEKPKDKIHTESDMTSYPEMKAKGGIMKKKSKMISEYGGKEKYSSKAPMKKHEKAEGPMMERKEEKMYMGMAKGGKVGRGCGAAMKGGGSVMKYGKKSY